MENSSEKPTTFLERHQSDGKVVVVSALLELDARMKNIQMMIEELREGMAGFVHCMDHFDDRLKKLEPTIQIFSEGEAKNILKG